MRLLDSFNCSSILSLLTILCLMMLFINNTFTCAESEQPITNDYSELARYDPYNTVVLGTYEQDGNQLNGEEPIYWRIIHRSEHRILLLSDKILDCGVFSFYNNNKWNDSIVCSRLNESFFQKAFNREQQKLIQSNDTEKLVFLLSKEEAEEYLSPALLKAEASDSARIKIAKILNDPWFYDDHINEKYFSWWLRTPGNAFEDHDGLINSVYYVTTDGEISSFRTAPDVPWYGYRPAIWVDAIAYQNAVSAENSHSRLDNSVNQMEKRNALLDTAFDQNRLILEAVEPFPEISEENMEISKSADMWVQLGLENTHDNELMLQNEAIKAFASKYAWSLSPTGKSGIVFSKDAILSYYNSKYRIVYPSSIRSQAEIGRRFMQYYLMLTRGSILGEEGVIYSQDGRYAALFNTSISMLRGNYIFDPIIIDLSTGEMILTKSYSSKMLDGNFGCVVSACFSADNHYFYYILYQGQKDYHSVLYQYDLLSQETTPCYYSYKTMSIPGLYETKTGSIIMTHQNDSVNEPFGLVYMSQMTGKWYEKDYIFRIPPELWSPQRLLYSSQTDYAIIPGWTITEQQSTSEGVEAIHKYIIAFQCIKPDKDCDGLSRYILISSDNNQVQSLRGDEFSRVIQDYTENGELNKAFHAIFALSQSPDGHYLLLNTASYEYKTDSSKRHMYLLRLDDMCLKEVQGMDPATIQVSVFAGMFKPIIEWNSDTILMITREGVQGFRFRN